MNYDIFSSQKTIHPDLLSLLKKYQHTTFSAPISSTQQMAFEALEKMLPAQKKLIVDAGCGSGDSTYFLSEQYPEHFIIGIDKSFSRLSQKKAYRHAKQLCVPIADNAVLLQADLIAQWQQMQKFNWHIAKLYFFYPNPWPKAAQLKRRFHAHPLFKTILGLTDEIEMRCNWNIYAEEFACACSYFLKHSIQMESCQPSEPISAFEKKYLASHTPLFRVLAQTIGANLI